MSGVEGLVSGVEGRPSYRASLHSGIWGAVFGLGVRSKIGRRGHHQAIL